jgi:hypothetical protein
MTAGPAVGIDLGALTVKTASGSWASAMPAPAGGPVAALRAALASASADAGICVAVPDGWLSGSAAGAARQEEVRHECEDVAGTGPVGWAGHLAAATVSAAVIHGEGRYLTCDIGGTGVRAGMFSVAGGTVRIEATHGESGGWREFDAALRAMLPSSQSARLPATWYEQAMTREKGARATVVLEEAVAGHHDALDTPVYRITGADGDIAITARMVIDSFAPAQERLQAAVAAVRGDVRPGHVVLTGGLGWLPLAALGAANAANAASTASTSGLGSAGPGTTVPKPVVLGPDAAARGALLFARGEARLAPPTGREPVAVPVHRIRNGLLEGDSVTLPWTEPFAAFPGGALTVDSEELQVTVAGRPHTARLRDVVPGPHRIGLRPAWPGSGVLVVRPATGEGAPHIVPLTDLRPR